VELIVQEGLQIVLAAPYLLTLGGNIHTDAALLELQSPRIHERHHKDDSQKTVQHNLYGVIACHPNGCVVDLVVLKTTLHRTDGSAQAEPVTLGQPVNAAAGNQHIADKHNLKQEEEQTAQDLSVIEIAKAEDQKGELHRPVTFREGGKDIHYLILYGETAILEEIQNTAAKAGKPTGNRTKKQFQVI
jgi:hypothetical protein